MTLSHETRMTTETELIFSPERTSNSSFHVFSSKKVGNQQNQLVCIDDWNTFQISRRRIPINQPPKPVSCRVYRYFTPAATRVANAVSVSSKTFGVGMSVLLSSFCTYSSCCFSFGKSILYKNYCIDVLGSMFWTSWMSRPWFICWSKFETKDSFLTLSSSFAWQILEI